MVDIPVDVKCEDCGNLTWRKELGAADRYWHNGYVCEEHQKNRSVASMYAMDGFQQMMGMPRIYLKEIEKHEQHR